MAQHGRRVVAVAVELLDRGAGHWCTRCALPSGWRFWVVIRTAARMHLQERRWCDECGRGGGVVLSDD